MDTIPTQFLKKLGLVAILIGVATSTLSAAPAVKTDPYNNDQTIIREGLNPGTDGLGPDQKPILPRIIYPFLPSGNYFQNWGSKDTRDAPDLGAVEAIIVFMAQAFSGTGSGGETGRALWKLAMGLGLFGFTLSGFLTFKAVTQGKKGIGEAIVSLLMKFIICFMMIQMIAPNIPPMLIGLSNAITKGIDGWFSRADAVGGSAGQPGANLTKSVYMAKMAAGVGAAAKVNENLIRATAKAAGNDPDMKKAVIVAIENLQSDPEFQMAIGKNGDLWNGWIDVEQLEQRKENGKAINDAISVAARLPASTVLALAEKHMRDAFKQNAPKAAPEPVLEAILHSTQGVDLTGFVIPDRLISTSAYIAFAYLSISIWGMGFAAILWAMLYAMPEEWNLGGALTAGFRACLAVVLAITLISIYMSAGLNFTIVKTEALSTKIPTSTDKFLDDVKDQLAATTDFVIDRIPGKKLADSAWAVGQSIVSVGSAVASGGAVGAVDAILASFFTGMTLEQFMIGLLILTAPAQAALMLKGANGIGDHAAKALNANGAGSQSLMGMMGMQSGSSGANAGGGFTASSIMNERGASRASMFKPGAIE